MLKLITSQKDLELFKAYVVREDVLQMISPKDIAIGEVYCIVSLSPSTPPDILLSREMKLSHEFNSYEFLAEVNNMDYYNPESIKNYILGQGEFKNWFENDNRGN